MNKKTVFMALVAAGIVTLTGCTDTRISKDTELRVDQSLVQAEQMARSAANPNNRVSHVDGLWFGGKTIETVQPVILPTIFYKKTIVIDRVNPMTISEVAERVTMDTGIPVRIAKEVLTPAGMPGKPGTSPSMPGLPPLPGAASGMNNASHVRLNYNGPLAGLLDTVAARFNTHWKYKDGVIQIYNLDTRTFTLNAIPGDAQLQANIGNGSSGSSVSASTASTSTPNAPTASASVSASGSSGTAQNTSFSSNLSVWGEVGASIKAMLSPQGAVVVSPASGTVTVTDTPEILDRVTSFMDRENRSLTRQVLINVRMATVSVNDGDQFGINWALVYKQLSNHFGFQLNNNFAVDTTASGFTVSVPSNASGQLAALGGSQAVLSALSQQAKVGQIIDNPVTTLNNQPASVLIGNNKGYLQSIQTNNTANVGSSTALVPGTISSGFNMNLLPHLLDNGTVLLQYSIGLVRFNKLDQVTSGGNMIQTPDYDTDNLLQRVALHSGETLVLTGFQQTNDSVTRQGVGSPYNSLFGGGIVANKAHNIVVVMITPYMEPGK